nr:putative ribonuclease H-like domain-containing protein [Tanacetum cinerariifolium]
PQDINGNASTQDNVDAGKKVFDQRYIMFPLWSSIFSTYKSSDDKPVDDKPKDDTVNTASTSGAFSAGGTSSPYPDAFIPANTLLHVDQDYSQIPDLEEIAELQKANFNNMESSTIVSPIPTHKVHIDHLKDQILGDPKSAVQTRGWQRRVLEHMLFLQKVWRLVDPPYGKKAIRTKWVYRNKKDERGIVVRNKARLVAQAHRQEEGIDYDEVFAHVARIEAIRIFLAFASFMGFIVYQMDVKSAFLYGTIEVEVYVSQPLGFIDPQFLNKVYKVEKAPYGLHKLLEP